MAPRFREANRKPRLERAAATLASPPWAAAARDKQSRQMLVRRRRTLRYGLVGIVVLLIGLGGLCYAAARQQPWEQDRLPARVANAEALAARGIPGWNRAKAAGLVVDLGITEQIAATDATVTLTNFGGGGGNITDDGRQGVVAIWDDTLPESFRQSDQLVLRYRYPSAIMILKETRDLKLQR